MFKKPYRKVSRVFIHCSASDLPRKGAALKSQIHEWHVDDRGWSDIGYHLLIDKEGSLIPARPLEVIPAAQKGHNTGSIAVMVHGLKWFTGDSMYTLIALCKAINEAYEGEVSFHGHHEVQPNKTCPVFDYKTVLQLDKDGFMK